MFTSASQGAGRRTIQDFEQIRSFFIDVTQAQKAPPLAVRIIAFGSRKEYEPYKTREFSSAYYLAGHDRDYIVMSRIGVDTRPTAIHEYVHLLVRHAGLKLPPWLNEGFAVLYSTLKPYAGKILVGELPPGRFQLLRRTKWLPLETLTSVDHNSPHYNEKNRAGLFYAQSWGLTHMLYLSEKYRSGFTEFVTATARGADAESAFRRVYGKSLEQVQKDLRAYMRIDRLMGNLFDTKLEKRAEKPLAQPASALESGMVLANLLASTRKKDQAREMYEKLAAEYPDAPEVPEALGYLATYSGGWEVARRHFARAVELGSTNPKLYYDHARSLYQSGSEDSEIEPLLRKAITLRPDHREARYLLAFSLYRQKRFGEALVNFARVKTVTPEQAVSFYRAVAYANYQIGRKEEAKKAANLAKKYARSPSEIEQVEQLDRWIEWAEEAKEAASTAQTLKTPLVTASDDVGEVVPRLIRRPRRSDEPKRQEEEIEVILTGPETSFVDGTLTQVDCSGNKARLHIVSENEPMVLAILDPTKIVIKGSQIGPVDLTCGPQQARHVVVGYVAKEGTGLEATGVVKSIEFR